MFELGEKGFSGLKVAALLYGIIIIISICEDTGGTSQPKNVLIVSAEQPNEDFCFPGDLLYREDNGSKVCLNISTNDCCNNTGFKCNFTRCENDVRVLDKDILNKQDVVLWTPSWPTAQCMPSKLYASQSDFLSIIRECFADSSTFPYSPCKTSSNSSICRALEKIQSNYIKCPPPTDPFWSCNDSTPENAVNILKNLRVLIQKMGTRSKTNFTIGNATGTLEKLPEKNLTDINISLPRTRPNLSISHLVHIPSEASEIAARENDSFVGVVLFPGFFPPDDPKNSFLNNEVLGVDMGTNISNLSNTIDIQFKNVNKRGNIASCRSWDGNGKDPIWVTDGCQLNETDDSITCRCTHLTFFAILMSPPAQNISSSDFRALSSITSAGCGVSMFFLAVGLFMHFLIRKGKASQATQILINLFIALFTLNLSFLTNESIANLNIFGACLAIAAVMHYTMLATFNWFFMEALHLYFTLWKIPTEIKHYMLKICIAGWATPAAVVIALLVAGKYNFIVINTDGGDSANMCWIPDAVVHQGVNVGYYAIVFVFTFTIFILTVRQIVFLKPTAGSGKDVSSTKKNTYFVLGLLLLLGITWAFAFFSHGPLLLPSYYIFTTLNSFQGFFLFIYYYYSSKNIVVDKATKSSSSISTITTQTAVTNVYQ